MKRIVVKTVCAAVLGLGMANSALAQWGGFSNSSSSSYSTNSSKSWGSSQGIGPNGVYNNNYNRSEGNSSFRQDNSWNTPWDGGSNGRTQNSGYRQGSFSNSGFSPSNGVYRDQGGFQDQYSNGSNYNNSWRW